MVKIEKLNCGATLITEKTDYFKSASIGIWVKSGSAYEDDRFEGISHYIEHMMFKGTSNRNAKEISDDFNRIGGNFNAFTGKEATCYYVKTLSSNICKGAEILLDMITNSLFDEEEMNKERNVIFEEIKMVKDCPDDDIMDEISEIVNSGNSFRKNILGSPESLNAIGRKEMLEYYENKYARDSIVVAVTGNFNEEELKETLDKGLEALREKGDAALEEVKPYKASSVVKVKDIEQTHICLATPGVSIVDPMYYAYVLMNNIFGSSMSSRLFQNIREEKGLAYSVSSMNVFNSCTGFFNIYAGVAHENVKKTIDAIRHELNVLVKDGVTEDELIMAKEQVKSSYIFNLENISSRMMALGRNMLLIGKTFSQEEVLSGFDRVTSDDILEAAANIGDLSSYCGAVVTNKDFDLEGLIRHGN